MLLALIGVDLKPNESKESASSAQSLNRMEACRMVCRVKYEARWGRMLRFTVIYNILAEGMRETVEEAADIFDAVVGMRLQL